MVKGGAFSRKIGSKSQCHSTTVLASVRARERRRAQTWEEDSMTIYLEKPKGVY
jgi:hypothetical protein